MTRPDARSMRSRGTGIVGYNVQTAEQRFARDPGELRTRCQTVEHPFGTLKHWVGATHFQMITLEPMSTEMSLHVLAYNMKWACSRSLRMSALPDLNIRALLTNSRYQQYSGPVTRV